MNVSVENLSSIIRGRMPVALRITVTLMALGCMTIAGFTQPYEPPPKEDSTKYYIYTIDVNTMETSVEIDIFIPNDRLIKEKVQMLCKFLTQHRFQGLPISCQAVHNRNGRTIAVVLLQELENKDHREDVPTWKSGYFQGSAGGHWTTEMLRKCLLQPDAEGKWIDGVEFYYQDGPIEPNRWDHIALSGTIWRNEETVAAPFMMYTDTSSGKAFAKDPVVIRFNDRYLMYYSFKTADGWAIGIAESANLIEWYRVGELLPKEEYEGKGICAPAALVREGKVHLFYQRYGFGSRDAICHAVSRDGLSFERDASNPIFQPSGAWNNGRAIDADVIEWKDEYLLYFATRDPSGETQMLGVASAPLDSDFSRSAWTQQCEAPILKPELPWEKKCIEAPSLCKHDGKLFMFYAGAYNNEPQQIGCATSEDGLKWERLSETPFLPNGKDFIDWNFSESGHPCFFEDHDGKTYLFHQGNNDFGRTWFLSQIPIEWKDGQPVLGNR